MCSRIIILVLIIGLTACSTNPKIIQTETCTTIQRARHSYPVTVRSESVKEVHMLNEWFPPPVFTGVSLLIPDSLTALGITGLYIDYSEESSQRFGECASTTMERQACAFADFQLIESGFAVTIVARETSNGSKIIKAAEEYYRKVSVCE